MGRSIMLVRVLRQEDWTAVGYLLDQSLVSITEEWGPSVLPLDGRPLWTRVLEQ
jgi:hypothetical protein